MLALKSCIGILSAFQISRSFYYLCNLLTGTTAFGTGPKGIDVAHLLLHMQTDIYVCGFHLVVGLEDIGVEHFPGACKEVGRGQSMAVT